MIVDQYAAVPSLDPGGTQLLFVFFCGVAVGVLGVLLAALWVAGKDRS